MIGINENEKVLYEVYAKHGFKALKCAGYHPLLNKETDPEKRYKRAKEPITKGYTKPDYKDLTLEECETWEAAAGWIGWVIPPENVTLDIDGPGWEERLRAIKAICSRAGLNPPIHRTNNGVHIFFKGANIPGNSQGTTKAGFKVTYRTGGKNQLILAPTNDRTWEIPLNGNLPAIPAELRPYDYKNKEDVLNVLAWQLGEAYRARAVSGFEDIDEACISFLIEASIDEGRALRFFETVYQGEYDERLTSQMYERAKSKIDNGEPVRGAGSFIFTLKERGLDDLLRIAQRLSGNNHPEESGISDEDPKADLLSSLLKWNDILNLDVRTEYILEKLLPMCSIILLFGRGGIGKTSLLMQIAWAIAKGLLFGNLQTRQTPVYYIDFENPLAVLKERVEKIGRAENLFVWHISNQIQPPKLDSSGWELYKQLPPGLLIFDTFRAAHLSDENDSKPMSMIMGRLKELREMGFTIVLLHHTPRSNENTFKGSGAILDLCDHVLGLEEVKDGEGNIEFDSENLYKLGVRLKTRYEPHSIFLTFDPAIKGFKVAIDPDIEKLTEIAEALTNYEKTPNQTEFRAMLKQKFGYTDHEARKLIRKGEGIYWNKTQNGEGKGYRAFTYVVMSDYIYVHTTTQQNLSPEITDTTSDKNSPLSLDNSHLLLCQNGISQNNITETDLSGPEVEVML